MTMPATHTANATTPSAGEAKFEIFPWNANFETGIDVVDAATQRDAAKAGAPLSKEPLSTLKNQLAERIKGVEDLQTRVQIQREAAVLLAQRIELWRRLARVHHRDLRALPCAPARHGQARQAQAEDQHVTVLQHRHRITAVSTKTNPPGTAAW